MTAQEIIKAILKDKRITQKELATRIGVTEGTIHRWTGGAYNPRWENMVAIAEATGYIVEVRKLT